MRVRDQLIDNLAAGHRAGWFRYLGRAGDDYVVEAHHPHGPIRRQYPLTAMLGWHDGFSAGRLAPAAGTDPGFVPPAVRELLVAPSPQDQRRLRILYVLDELGLLYKDVAAGLHAQRSTIRGLLAYGAEPQRVHRLSRSIDEIEAWLQDQAGRWPKLRRPKRGDPVAGLAQTPPEPAHMRRLRALTLAAETGIVVEWDPQDPNQFRPARIVYVDTATGKQPRTSAIAPAAVIWWLQGLADGAGTVTTSPDAVRRIATLATALTY